MADFITEMLKIAFSATAGGVAGGVAGFLVAQRSERDSAIKDLINKIDSVADLAETYWCMDGRTENISRRSQRLKVNVKEIAKWNERIARDHPTYRFYSSDKLIAFRQSITDGNFETVNRAPEVDRTERVLSAALELKNAILDSRCRLWHLPRSVWFQYGVKFFHGR